MQLQGMKTQMVVMGSMQNASKTMANANAMISQTEAMDTMKNF